MWSRQPQYPAPLDPRNPLTRGLQFCFDGRARRDAVSGRLLTPAKPSFIKEGLATAVTGASDVPQLSGGRFTSYSGFSLFVLLRHGTHSGNFCSLIGRGNQSFGGSTSLMFDESGLLFLTCDDGTSKVYPGGSMQAAGTHSYGASQGSAVTGYIDGESTGSAAGSISIYDAQTWIVGATSEDFLDEFIAGDYLFAGAWNRPLTAREFAQIHKDPWQVYAPAPRGAGQVIILPVTVSTQKLGPVSDVAAGSWAPSSGSDLYAMLDETAYNDADYIYATSATTCTLAMASGSSPGSGPRILRYRLLAGSGTITVTLKQSSTTIASWGPHTLTGAAQDFAQTLTSGEAASITDYSALRVEFTSSLT